MSDKTVTVQATAPGYFLGPRAVGEKFEMPLGKGGAVPTSRWFKAVVPAKAKAAPGAKDEELA